MRETNMTRGQIESDFLHTLKDFVHTPDNYIINPEHALDRELLNLIYQLIDLRTNPPKEKPKLKTLEEHNTIRRTAYESFAEMNKPRPNGIACPNCGEELMDSDPSMTLASDPPQKNTKCPSCDYRGYRVA